VRSSGLVGFVVADVAGVVGTSEAGALGGAVGVTLSTVAVGVDTGIGLVAEARVVGTRGVRVAGAAVSTSEARASGVVTGQTRAGGVVAGQTRASGVVAGQARACVSSSAAVLASTVATGSSGVASGTVAVRVDAGIGPVGEVGVVRTRGVRSEVRAGVAASVRSATSEAGSGVSTGGRAVLTSTDTASARSVAGRAVAVGVNTRVELVGKLGVVRTSRIATVGVGAVSVGAGEAAASVCVAAVSQAGT
jgi:hypothetical protein